jgi:hypothetical protein
MGHSFLLQWRQEMQEAPYNYVFPFLKDNMRNSSKVRKWLSSVLNKGQHEKFFQGEKMTLIWAKLYFMRHSGKMTEICAEL